MTNLNDGLGVPGSLEEAHATAEQLALELMRLAARLRRAGHASKASAAESRAESWIVRATLLAEEREQRATESSWDPIPARKSA
jgi:hypothetical protein